MRIIWTNEMENDLVELRQQGVSWSELPNLMTKKYNMRFTRDSCRNKYRALQRKGLVQENTEQNNAPPKFKEENGVDFKKGTGYSDKLIELANDEEITEEKLLLAHGYDPKEWKITKVKNSMWQHHNKQDGTKTLLASRIEFEKRGNEISIEKAKEIVTELMAGYEPLKFEPTRYASNGKLLEVNISDLHLNKLGFMKGVYNQDVAERTFYHILNDVLTRTSSMLFEKILFIWSHDFFNIDNMARTTTAGTPQDTTMRYSDMYKKGKEMLIKGIDLLSQVAPVETVQVGANHDRLTSYTLSEVLHAWYRNNDNVTIDNDPLSRKYRRFGKCLIGFSHGNQERKRLGKIMPVEARKDWGETLYAEIHAAHIHTEKAVEEDNGVIIRYLSTPSGTDRWHFESGYVGSVPKAQSFIWDRDLGLMDIINTPIIPSYPDLVKVL